MAPAERPALADLLADDVAGLEDAVARGESIVVRAWDHHVLPGPAERVGLPLKDAEVLQDVEDAAPADAHALDMNAPPAAELGAEREHAPPRRR